MKNALSFCRKNLLDKIFNFDDDDFLVSNFTNSPKVNVKETDKAYEIEIATPGFNKENTEVKVTDGVLYVFIDEESENEENIKYHVRQWSRSSYAESWNLPENVIEDQISAKHNDGVLTITLPKKEVQEPAVKSRKIEIE